MKTLARGKGPLFITPDPFKFREYNRNKSRSQKSKVSTVPEAIRAYIKDGNYIATGGFGTNRIPTALLHEIVRQKKKNLGFAGHTTTHDYQILVNGNCLDRVDAAYIVGLESRGLSSSARKAHQEGRIEVCEWSNASLGWRLSAGARGIPFFATYVNLGTDTFKYSAGCVVKCPYTKKPVLLVPALNPDIGLIHVHRADEMGNCEIEGITVSDADIAAASKITIATTEELVPTDYFRKHPERTTIPWICIDAVIKVKNGSFPGNMAGRYYSDEKHLKQWLDVEKDDAKLKRFMNKYIYNTKNFNKYLEICGGLERIKELRSEELFE